MRDARLRVSKPAALTWGDVEWVCGVGQAACVGGVGEDNYRVMSTDSMKLELPVRRGAGEGELVLAMRPN